MQSRSMQSMPTLLLVGFVAWLSNGDQNLHSHEGHQGATYRVTPSATQIGQSKQLRLKVVDAGSGRPIAARFTLTVDKKPYVPPNLGRHGLRFLSIHQRKQHLFTATYVRGTGDVLVPLPNDGKTGTVTVAKGFEFVPATTSFEIDGPSATAEIRLERWVDLQAEGWHAADEHLHYERTAPRHDGDWLTMLDADGLSHAHFLVLKGFNLPGIWAQQFAYGKEGEASKGKKWIRPGEEYRDPAQGHINLLGVEEVIPPISTGGIGEPAVPFNYPPFLDVLRRTHELQGIGGPAHGAALGLGSTAVLDTILGEVDFFEIANTHLYKTDVWYQLLNCGFIVPPVAGTDLPNFGFRDAWQPLLGEVRTYVRTGDTHNFDAWKQAIHRGEVFVTSGPVISFDVDGVGPGGVVRLPSQGGQVTITAELASPRPLDSLEVVSMGQTISVDVKRTDENGIHRLGVKHLLAIKKSCWLATRGTGGPKTAVEQGLGIRQNVMAHTGVVQVLVDDQPIRLQAEVDQLRKQLAVQQEHYRTEAKFEKPEHRFRFLELFDQAIGRLD